MAKFVMSYRAFATPTTTPKTVAKIISATGKRFEVVEVGMFGAGTVAPADVQHECQVGFLTNTGAGTATANPTPEKADQSSAVSALTTGTAYSAEPTTYNTVVSSLFSFNQRGGMRWAVPQGEGFRTDDGQAAKSFGQRVVSSVAGSVDGNILWWEP